MNLNKIEYYTKRATAFDILSNLKDCDLDFWPPLSDRVNLEEYSNKIYENSITFEAWNNNRLIGMVATYFNNIKNSVGYITNVCVENNFKGKNIASDLMRKCIDYAKENKFNNIILEVNENNIAAVNLYKKFNFKSLDIKNGNIKMLLELNNTTNLSE